MDVGNFVPKQVRDYYESPPNSFKDRTSSRETRQPYRAMINSNANDKISKCSKRMTQQFQNSRNKIDPFFNMLDESKNYFNHTQGRPLKDITSFKVNETNSNIQDPDHKVKHGDLKPKYAEHCSKSLM